MSYKRENNSSKAFITRTIYAEGTFKLVRKGKYDQGSRAGEVCVAKEFKSGSVYEDHYFDEELKVIAKAQKVVDAWNYADIVNRRIILNNPQVWIHKVSLRMSLVEPFIENYEKFNSNTGWTTVTGDVWGKVMQALSHFSYHNSGGQFLLCDLQGGCYSNGYVLSDPVIMSQAQDYGPADLGPDGIRSFFARHQCNDFCSHSWMKPKVIGDQLLLPMRAGTTMTNLPTRPGRNPLTRLRE